MPGAAAYPLIEYEHHTLGTIELDLDRGLDCPATCFRSGLAE
jgi:hypothetical protein